jgi:hypothetical protein
MSFLRHEQIYQSDVFSVCAPGLASLGFAPERLIVLMSLRPAIPRRVALLHCSLPLHRAIAIVKEVVGGCQPPLGWGWGIFSWRFGEISIGVDNYIPAPLLWQRIPQPGWGLTGSFSDRNTKLGFQNALNYQIVVNWMIAEHKSQGLLQTMTGKEQFECFWLARQDNPDARRLATELFREVIPAGSTFSNARHGGIAGQAASSSIGDPRRDQR